MGNNTGICQSYFFQQQNLAVNCKNHEITIEPIASRQTAIKHNKQKQQTISPSQNPSKTNSNVSKSTQNFPALKSPTELNSVKKWTAQKSTAELNSAQKCSPSRITSLNLQDMIVIREQEGQMNTDLQIMQNIHQDIEVPFSILKLTVCKELNQTIQILGRQLLQKFQDVKVNNKWKLHAKGFYVNYIAEDLTVVLTNQYYYEGTLVQINNQHVPEGQGIFLDKAGMFKGNFVKGKAEGNGTYVDKNKTNFKGNWKNGQLVSGIIDNNVFTFNGALTDGYAHGKGLVNFKHSLMRYRGQFRKGQYQGHGIFQCQKYIYEGNFQKGKKNGNGCLTEKQIKTKYKKSKYRPSQVLNGQWGQDYFKYNSPAS